MTDLDQTPARRRLDAALDDLSAVFAGMTARPDEHNCPCHWGSAEDLAQLKTPDVELSADLLDRTWRAPDWTDHASVLRRILPQFASALVGGLITPFMGMAEVGLCLSRGSWQQWPDEQAATVQEFLDAWWAWTLAVPDPSVAAHDVLALSTEATATLAPWLTAWEAATHPEATRHLAEAVVHWEYELLGDQLPWDTYNDEDRARAELTTWLVSHASARLREHGADEDLLHRIRLMGLTGPARWDDPHWPGHRY